MKIFFVSDLHGAELCFRKFVNAGRFYKADWLVMGGDAGGKLLVPLVQHRGSWVGHFQAAEVSAETEQELNVLEQRLADRGAYTLRTTPDFVKELAGDPDLVEKTLKSLILERARHWVDLAADRLGESGPRCLMGLGNDDYEEMGEIFNQGPLTFLPDGLAELDGFTVGSIGWSNVTPWHTNRELTEEQLAGQMAALREAPEPDRTIFNIHVPPYKSGLDSAPRLSEDLQIQLVAGTPDLVPVGSEAVADGIREQAPLLSLHGHIHESRGVVHWGRTTVVNCGSEYDQGVLLGALIDVTPGRVRSAQLVAA